MKLFAFDLVTSAAVLLFSYRVFGDDHNTYGNCSNRQSHNNNNNSYTHITFNYNNDNNNNNHWKGTRGRNKVNYQSYDKAEYTVKPIFSLSNARIGITLSKIFDQDV